MLIAREDVVRYLDGYLKLEDKKHFDLMVDLVRAATIVHEFGFSCPADKREEMKSGLLETVEELTEERVHSDDVLLEESGLGKLSFYGDSDRSPTMEDLATLCNLFYLLVYTSKKISKEKMLGWLRNAWDVGVYQRRVYDGEIEGNINNELGVVLNFGATLALGWGAAKGLILS